MKKTPLKTVLFIIVLNLTIVAAEMISGLLANSISLISDALHNLGDVLAVFVTFLALYLGTKKASTRMTFGYLRAEMMAGFVNGLFLFLTMLYILYEAIGRLFDPAEVLPEYMMVVAGIALVANAFSALLLHRVGGEFSHTHHHHEDDTAIHHAHHGDECPCRLPAYAFRCFYLPGGDRGGSHDLLFQYQLGGPGSIHTLFIVYIERDGGDSQTEFFFTDGSKS